jgi:hypothetical protein
MLCVRYLDASHAAFFDGMLRDDLIEAPEHAQIIAILSADKPQLDWEHYAHGEWCADGDGFYVVRPHRRGFHAVDNNSRQSLGVYSTLEQACVACEKDMRMTPGGMFHDLIDRYPAHA